MGNKNRYFLALKDNKGRLSEMELGELLELKDYETHQLLAQLLSEHKIAYDENGYCRYRIMKGFRGENRKRNLG